MLNKWKSEYEELKLKPSPELWSRLEMELEKESEKAIEKPFHWWKYAAVILLCISVGGLFYVNSNDNHNFSEKKADYVVRKVLPKVDPTNPEFQNPLGAKDNSGIQNHITSTSRNQKASADVVSFQELEKEAGTTKSLAIKVQNIVMNQDEKVIIKPPKIEIHTPVIADVKKNKPTYINSSELLLGREFDKSSGSSDKKDFKIGILNLDKPVPEVENVTVLGVTVYVESK